MGPKKRAAKIHFTCILCKKEHCEKPHLCKPFAHLKTRDGQKPYVCTPCYKAFVPKDQASNLRRSKGEKQRSFVCSMCQEGFTQQRFLNTHVLKHKEDTSFICCFCYKGFCNFGMLTRHLQTHTGEDS